MLTSMLALVFAAATQLVLQIPSTNWENQSVLFAEVVNATQLSAAGWSIRLSPSAVLTGNFDPAFTGRIDAGVWIDDLAGVIAEAPKNGTKVIVVVQHAVLNQKDVYSIPNGSATFFRNRTAGYNPLNKGPAMSCCSERFRRSESDRND
jgi:hypothetical protein